MMHKHEDDPSPAALDIDDNDNYDSAEDSDFQLDDEAEVAGDDSGLSSSEEEEQADDGGRPAKKRKIIKQRASKKRKGPRDGDDDMELDSGDEATISKARSKKKKKSATEDGDEEEDIDVILSDNEEGGFVKTRSMRMKMVEEQRPLARIDGATIDVEDLWAKMNAPDTESGLLQSQNPSTEEPEDHEQQPAEQEKERIADGETTAQGKLPSEDMIKIKRTYKFAGEIHTEEKMVPRDSAEAKLYLAETTGEKAAQDSAEGSQSETVVITLRRPLRKVSRFDPNPLGIIKKSWEKQPVRTISGDADDSKGPKLNTVEKSRLDWAQYVDEAGIKDELNVHSKAKEGYLGRMDFLGRVDAKREEERRNIRLKGL